MSGLWPGPAPKGDAMPPRLSRYPRGGADPVDPLEHRNLYAALRGMWRSGETAGVLERATGGDQCRASGVPTRRDDPRDGTADGYGPRRRRACYDRGQEGTAVCRVAGAGATATLHGWPGAVVGEQQTWGCLAAQAPRPRSPGDAAVGGAQGRSTPSVAQRTPRTPGQEEDGRGPRS
jgi:hypothetical protein